MVMGRNGHGSIWLWADLVMGRNDPGPFDKFNFSKKVLLRYN